MSEEEIGFKPSRKCPVCGERHVVEYQYKGIDLLVCSKMEEDRMMLLNEEASQEGLEFLKSMQRYFEPKLQ